MQGFLKTIRSTHPPPRPKIWHTNTKTHHAEELREMLEKNKNTSSIHKSFMTRTINNSIRNHHEGCHVAQFKGLSDIYKNKSLYLLQYVFPFVLYVR